MLGRLNFLEASSASREYPSELNVGKSSMLGIGTFRPGGRTQPKASDWEAMQGGLWGLRGGNLAELHHPFRIAKLLASRNRVRHGE